MATGDQNDFATRIAAEMPRGWVLVSDPIASAVFQGLGAQWASIYQLLTYTQNQTRIATATGGWLDLVSNDFFGVTLPRQVNETDAAFRARIIAAVFQAKNTRQAIIAALTALTGVPPDVFEPMRPADTGGWGAQMGWGTAGRWGNMLTPYVAYVNAYRPAEAGIPNVPGWGAVQWGWGASGCWADYANSISTVTDELIYAAANNVRPAGVTLWVQISDAPGA